ncbi:MAG: serine hydrolase domain-containing protein [Pseudomonadota bacterium]
MKNEASSDDSNSTRQHINYRLVAIISLAVIVTLGTGFFWFGATVHSKIGALIVESDGASVRSIASDWAAHPSIAGVIIYAEENDNPTTAVAVGTTTKKSGVPVNVDTHFHTASVGKLFTAAAVLKLAEDGVFGLDDPASQYLPEGYLDGWVVVDGLDRSNDITIRQLVSHRSGLGQIDGDFWSYLPYFFQPKKVWAPDELIDLGRRIPVVGAPGKKTKYSSTNYHLLGLVIEAATKKPYHEVVRSLIFNPLGMTDTFESSNEWQRGEYLHYYEGVFDISNHHPSFEFADGGFVTTARDLVTFGKALVNQQIFDQPETYEEMIKAPDGADPNRYMGLGVWVYQTEDGRQFLKHTGYWGVNFIMFPAENQFVAYSLAQSHADLTGFWRQIEPYVWAQTDSSSELTQSGQ